MILLRFALVLMAAAGAGVDLPRIGCWRESASAGPARVLFGVAGNLVVRPAGEEGCENEAEWSAPDDGGVRTLRIDRRWQLAMTAEGERYLLFRGAQRYELPQ